MPIKSQKKKPGHWLGFKEVAIVRIEDNKLKNPKLEKLDIGINVVLDVKDSDYDHILQLMGNFLREEDSNDIKDCRLLGDINNFADAIGFEGGVDISGNWVDKDDKPIEDIVKYLTDNYVKYNFAKVIYNYFTYLYEELNEKNGKVYTRVYKKIVPNTPENVKQHHEYITFCINKGYLKEYKREDNNNVNTVAPAVEGAATMD